jgi:stage V sporulation protein G
LLVEITEVRIKLVTGGNDKLRAFCSVTIDNDFVIRDLKVIDGNKGPFVAMPSRKLMQRCPRCSGKNPYRANYCNDCGGRLPPPRHDGPVSRGPKLHADIAHPINSRCRELMQAQILEEYEQELDRARQPGYQPARFDDYEETFILGSLERTAGGPPAEPAAEPRSRRDADEFVEGDGEPDWISAGRRRYPGERPPGRREDAAGGPAGGRRRQAPRRTSRGDSRPELPSGGRRPEPERDTSRMGKLSDDDASFRRRARFQEETETEPEDNFGAGIFS